MEVPVSGDPDDVRDEKNKALRCVAPPRPEDCVLGQYTAGECCWTSAAVCVRPCDAVIGVTICLRLAAASLRLA